MAIQTQIKNISTENNDLFVTIAELKALGGKPKRDMEMFEKWIAECNKPDEDDKYSEDKYLEYKCNTRNRVIKKTTKGINTWSSRGKKRIKEARSRKRTNRCNPTQQEFDGMLVWYKK
jgi:hypothetical protein